MKIELTREQYRDLLLNVIIGTYIREAVDEDDGKDITHSNDLEKYLLSLARDFDSEDMIEDMGDGHLIPSEEVCGEYHDKYIEEFVNESFWDRLERDLGQRDFDRQGTEEEKKKVKKNNGWLTGVIDKYYEKYAEEFEKHGIERLEIKK